MLTSLAKLLIEKEVVRIVDPFYAVVRVITRFWIWFFFERVEVRHPEPVASMGPVLLCINHPNKLIDSLLVRSVLRKSSWFPTVTGGPAAKPAGHPEHEGG